MYKERTGGHNRSSTKEKRNTYPPLFSKLRRENALGLIFWLKIRACGGWENMRTDEMRVCTPILHQFGCRLHQICKEKALRKNLLRARIKLE